MMSTTLGNVKIQSKYCKATFYFHQFLCFHNNVFSLTEHLPLKNGILIVDCLFSKSHLIEIIKQTMSC